MVKKVLKFLAYLLFFIFALILFVPKEGFYYLLEQNIKKFDLIISHEKLEDKRLFLEVQNLDISAKGIQTLTIEEADIMLLALYDSITLHNIELSSMVKSYLPAKIDALHIYYTILHPLLLQAEGEGRFGHLSVRANLVDKKVRLLLQPSQLMLRKYRRTLRMLKKSKNGEYIYEKSL